MKKFIAYILLTLLIVNPTFATFNVVASGDPILASKAMQNWRHVNYGSALLPVTIGGAGVDSTIDLGSNTYKFKDLWADNIAGGIVFNEAGSDVDFRVEGVGAANALFVQGSDGNVGIGTTAPGHKLDIAGASIAHINTGGNTNFYFGGGVGSDEYGVLHWNQAGNYLSLSNQANANTLVVKDGNVGIRTSAPGTPLHVIGNTTLEGYLYLNTSAAPLIQSTPGADTDDFRITWRNAANTQELGGLYYEHDNHKLLYKREGVPQFVIDNAGNVGIGETSPSAKLEVLSTTTQALLSYSDGVDTSLTVNSSGDLVINNSGTKTVFNQDVNIEGMLNIDPPTELTIAGGIITVSKSFHTVDTQADASTDDLDTINGGTIGDILVLSTADSSRDVVIKNGTGNINCGAAITLGDIADKITFIYTSAGWDRLSNVDN